MNDEQVKILVEALDRIGIMLFVIVMLLAIITGVMIGLVLS